MISYYQLGHTLVWWLNHINFFIVLQLILDFPEENQEKIQKVFLSQKVHLLKIRWYLI